MTSVAERAIAEVIDRERRLLDPAVRISAAAVAALLHEDFREFGASGTIWDKTSTVASLAAEPGGPVEVSDLLAERLAADVVLVTYTVRNPARTSLRSSIWVKGAGSDWLIRFHQGTVLAQSGGSS